MITIRGSHGTKASNVESIMKSGWKARPGGIIGSGIYFWDEGDHNVNLAFAWCRQKLGQDDNTSCAAILADLNSEEESILNCDDEEFTDIILSMGLKYGFNLDDNNILEKLYDSYISKVELKGIKVKIVKKRVPPPSRGYRYPLLKLKGGPRCCSVRDTRCIKVVKTIVC